MGPTRSGRGGRGLMGDINVTPLVDVMLVLLIIFMVTAPMMTQGLEVDLPQATTNPLPQQEKPLIVTIDKEEAVSLGEEKLGDAALKKYLGALPAEQKEQVIYLRADKTVPYGRVTLVMANIQAAGFSKIGVITVPLEEKP